MMVHDLQKLNFYQFVPLILVALLYAAYLWAVVLQYLNGYKWKPRRVINFAIGIGLLIVALLPSVHHYAAHDIRGHMAQHLLIGMLAPIGLAFGAPMVLTMRTLPKRASRLLTLILHSKPIHWLTHPVTALALNIGGMFVLYLTPLYQLSLENIFIHWLVHLHFLVAGYLFVWSLVGPDPAPKRPTFKTRLAVLFVAMAAHASLSKYMYAHFLPQGTHHPTEQIQAAAKIMYYGGDFSEIILAVALFSIWNRKKFKEIKN